MKKLFISQPMSGRTDEEILSERKDILEKVSKMVEDDVEEIDSFFDDGDSPHESLPVLCLGKSIALLSGADFAVFADGWEKRRGCRVEHMVCIEYGIEILEL